MFYLKKKSIKIINYNFLISIINHMKNNLITLNYKLIGLFSNSFSRKNSHIYSIAGINRNNSHLNALNIIQKYNLTSTSIPTQIYHQNLSKFQINLNLYNLTQDLKNSLQYQLKTINCKLIKQIPQGVPKFFRTLQELNYMTGQNVMSEQKYQDNPYSQFQDQEYRKRRNMIANLSINYKMGEQIPIIDYTNTETNTWKLIYKELRSIHKLTMSNFYDKQFKIFQRQFDLNEKIPQLAEIDKYLQKSSGFRIKPTHGILSAREFLNALALKVFCASQYIRHHENPYYSPQPDYVHEIIGHVPMFADKSVANFSQKIGLLSLGASDDQIKQLAALYMFTIEFGATIQNQKTKTYGAGIASSVSQLQYFLSGKAKFELFDPFRDSFQDYPIDTFQPVYKITKTFQQALQSLQKFQKTLQKQINVSYNSKKKEVDFKQIQQIEYTQAVNYQ